MKELKTSDKWIHVVKDKHSHEEIEREELSYFDLLDWYDCTNTDFDSWYNRLISSGELIEVKEERK